MNLKRLTLVLAATVLAAAALAQPMRGGGMMRMGGGDNPAFLLMREDVQRDLALTDEQKGKLEALRTEQMEAMRARMQEIMGGGGQPDREVMRKEMEKFQEENTKRTNAILTEGQQKRLQEISIQLSGNRAVMRPEVAKQLGITEAQQRQINTLRERMQEANQSLMQRMRDGELDRDQLRGSMERNNTVMNDELGKVLTQAQKDKLKEMGGTKKFVADPPQGG